MVFTSSHISDVHELELVCASSTYGMGLLTGIIYGLCHVFGTECRAYDWKIQKAKESADEKLAELAYDMGADGVMNIRYLISGMTVFVSGLTYMNHDKVKNETETDDPNWHDYTKSFS